VHAGQHRLAIRQIAHGQHNVLFIELGVLEAVDIEVTPHSGQARGFNETDSHAVLP
jgi:hypothetical protein